MTSTVLLAKIEALFVERGADEYHGEAVSQLEHALQAAWLAEQEGAEPALIVAALLHDIGHLIQSHGEAAAERGIDDRHEELGQKFLRKHFPESVTEPIRLHVEAKRYLSAVDSSYHDFLSPASRLSLQLQGGPMTTAEQQSFEANLFCENATRLRKWDDKAKIANLPTPTLSHFLPHISSMIGTCSK